MRTLALLAALLLLASQAQARPGQEAADQVPAQDQPVADDQDLLEDEDGDVPITIPGEERLARQLTLFPHVHICKCRRRRSCKTFERVAGRCGHLGVFRLCCK